VPTERAYVAFSGTVEVLPDLNAGEGDLADLGSPQLGGRASKEGGELAVVEEIVTCGGGADIAEDEIKAHEELAVKEKKGPPGSGACDGGSGHRPRAKTAINGERQDTFHSCRFGFVEQLARHFPSPPGDRCLFGGEENVRGRA
jgi:hypothetical protein